MYIRVDPSCKAQAGACYNSEENRKGFSEGNGLDRWNEIGDFVYWYTGRKLQKRESITQRKLVKKPSESPVVTVFQRCYGTIEYGLL